MVSIRKEKARLLGCIRGAAAVEYLTAVGAALTIGYGLYHFATQGKAKANAQGGALVGLEDTLPSGGGREVLVANAPHTHTETVMGPNGPIGIPVPDRLAPDDPSRRDRSTMGVNMGVAGGSLTIADPDDVHNARITGSNMRLGGEVGGFGLGFERTTETTRTGTQTTTKTTIGPVNNTDVTTDPNQVDPGRRSVPYSGPRYPGGGR